MATLHIAWCSVFLFLSLKLSPDAIIMCTLAQTLLWLCVHLCMWPCVCVCVCVWMCLGASCQVKQEWEVHSSLHHPNIIQAYCGTEDSSGVRLFMEYAGDSDAYSYINAKQRLSLREDDARQLVYDMLTALQYMHSQVGHMQYTHIQAGGSWQYMYSRVGHCSNTHVQPGVLMQYLYTREGHCSTCPARCTRFLTLQACSGNAGSRCTYALCCGFCNRGCDGCLWWRA